MESLGFTDSEYTWSDSPQAPVATIATPEPVDPLSAWEPAEFGGRRYDGSNFRWSLLVLFIVAIAGVGVFGYWLYQRPAVEASATAAAVAATADDLEAVLPALETFNATLPDVQTASDPSDLFAVDAAARSLFNESAALGNESIATRSSAAAAAGSALDGIRLAGDTHVYKMAVLPLLAPPTLETDPALIGLDDAARAFGDWQLRFDEVRTALPDGVLPDVTEQLDVLSGDLSGILTDYVDALRTDDRGAVQTVLEDLEARLDGIGELLSISIAETQTRVAGRIAAARTALADLDV